MESAFHIVVSQRLKSQEIACEAYAVFNNTTINKRRNKISTFTIVVTPYIKPYTCLLVIDIPIYNNYILLKTYPISNTYIVVTSYPTSITRLVVTPYPKSINRLVVISYPTSITRLVLIPYPTSITRLVVTPYPTTLSNIHHSLSGDTLSNIHHSLSSDTLSNIHHSLSSDTVSNIHHSLSSDTLSNIHHSLSSDTLSNIHHSLSSDTLSNIHDSLSSDTLSNIQHLFNGDTLSRMYYLLICHLNIVNDFTFQTISHCLMKRGCLPKLGVGTFLEWCALTVCISIFFSFFTFKPEGPQMPNLTVLYHRPPSIVEVDKILVAHCDACVGMNGNITWRLLNESDQPVVNEILLQLLTVDQKHTEGNLKRSE
ncbi:LOW QUALITY PROTEIN: protein jagged-1-like [Plakobranchus ocellatus]|uniref:Protein jagged-1-like n=1 Tax=Plakobranchus ocellatus TaxID=259542 RepID=A0AAV3YPY7_9GAST|nr:LOW QUALITY PROTEIN: protein jagged-1-like [Plakobranchus ocellatus]